MAGRIWAAVVGGLCVAAIAGPAPAQDDATGIEPLKTFRNWLVGCDNLRSCTAVGMISDEDIGAHIKIVRGGAPADLAQISITIDNQDVPEPGELGLKLTTYGRGGPQTPQAKLAITTDGSFVTGTLEGEQAHELIQGLRDAEKLVVTVTEGPERGSTESLPLGGSAAALLYMDDVQRRVDTVTALTQIGRAPASSMPPVPEKPKIDMQKLAYVVGDLPARPDGITPPGEDTGCTSDFADIVIRLTETRFLWGVCNQTGAYNLDFQFWIVGDGAPRLAVFPTVDADAEITNLGVSEDGLTLTSFAKGRGIGDCGVSTEWAWDGEAFVLAFYSEMDDCRGVISDDWPVLYRAGPR